MAFDKDDYEKIEDTLPDKASDLIDAALEDLEKTEGDKNYIVNMNVWHSPRTQLRKRQCYVCMAGGMMAIRLGANLNLNLVPIDYKVEIYKKLMAIDFFRRGEVEAGLWQMGIPAASRKRLKAEYKVTPYHESAEFFKKDMRFIADKLREAEL